MPLHYPHPSKRHVSYAKNGMVATSQPLAAQAGLTIMQQGGNAIDAAIATAATLTVVEPTSNGIGGDAFAIVWVKGELHGMNASGRSPAMLTRDALPTEGGTPYIPTYGWTPVTVPGAPAAWAALHGRFGKLPFAEVLAPAIQYAEEGYPLSPVLGYHWERAFHTYKQKLSEEAFQEWMAVFAPEGKAPAIGSLWRSPRHAETLREIAETKAESMYHGTLAEKIDAASKQAGGFIRKEDLAKMKVDWVDPVSIPYRDHDIWELPPNGQGITALMALQMVSEDSFHSWGSENEVHLQIEAMKLAFSDAQQYITDADHMTLSLERLLSSDYAQERRKLINHYAIEPTFGDPSSSGTVYLSTADGEGNMVSFIQSNYMGFGSGIVVPGTGISLQNRGHNFSTDPRHPNVVAPEKRTFHTIIPGFITKEATPYAAFGVMGGFMQPQGHMQAVMNLLDYQLNPQAALDAPRWQWTGGKKVLVEQSMPASLVHSLVQRGHEVQIAPTSYSFGRGQIITRNEETGVLSGGTEMRTDGQVAVF
ncbi:gamma-glutamyltransferase family protein [Aureibacillus halotolerans]|uniref:Gamma-glutamyltransferase 2 n=1 Tax=Aureibacillus halotolerans TaxID=1508390 RepID=A0A4R6U2Q1_9BACI|nr:gamma-glutamyltransferase family protein [Aureibacillus halotolerans]TDQ38719.1 gamma-glutamyltransferase 2 [Aureibacillus halotolerans]